MDVNIGMLAAQAVAFILLFIVPPLIVATSKRVEGVEKIAWVFLSLLTSWLGLILYLIFKGGR